MWSGPRNISTAMMYAFANREDCLAWDEPFYGAYLAETGLQHPMRAEILAACENDWRKVEATCLAPAARPVFYQKHMTHHMLPAFDRKFIRELSNAFLIRSPEKVLASYAKKHDEVTLHAIGFVEQAEIFDMVAQHLGHAPPVVDADVHLAGPRASFQKLCHALGIPFREAMLAWPKGPKACDGVWAPHWYNAAWASTGFEAPASKAFTLPPELQRICDAARPYYEKLKAHALPA
ncbi:MAG: HAD family hydrolase [Alphaproteobacteria bacterium]|nr:HAD family hydrolase [Alphaproteobacteria bacterium]